MNKWLNDIQLISPSLSEAQRSWVCYPGSMTSSMQAVCNDVEIIVFRQRYSSLLRSESDLFNHHTPSTQINNDNPVWAREIMMLCDGTPWLYARTVIPEETLKLFNQVTNLGSTAIGRILFSDSEIHRHAFSYALLDNHSDTLQAAMMNSQFEQQPYLARRSLFVKQQQPLQLTEIFLPAMLNDNNIVTGLPTLNKLPL